MKSQRIAKSKTARLRRKKIKSIIQGKTERLYSKLRKMRRSRRSD